jgi:hypothetical protein
MKKAKKLKVATKALAILDKKLKMKKEELATGANAEEIKTEIQKIESKKELIQNRVQHLQEMNN